MKILFLIIILVGFTYIGYSWSKKYKEKLLFYNELLDFCSLLENEIRFNKLSVRDIVLKHYSRYKSEFSKVLYNFFLMKKDYSNLPMLSEKENGIVGSFLRSLGKVDVVGEIGNLASQKIRLNQLHKQSSDDNKQYGGLGTKLGFIFGFLLLIVLI